MQTQYHLNDKQYDAMNSNSKHIHLTLCTHLEVKYNPIGSIREMITITLAWVFLFYFIYVLPLNQLTRFLSRTCQYMQQYKCVYKCLIKRNVKLYLND